MKGLPGILGSWMLSAGLILACAYLWIASGIGNNLTPMVKATLLLILVAALAALVSGALGRKKLTGILQGAALAGVIGLVVHSQIQVSGMRESDKPGRIAKNAGLIASALSVLPCGNGDTALLKESRHEASGFYSKSIWIVPRDRTLIAGILVSATGKFKPPSDQEVRSYLLQSGSTCGNREYPTLMDLMHHLQKHHQAESHKYQKAAGP